MFSWLMEGLAGARPHTARTNVSTRALPRDVTLDPATDMLLQRPVPELKSLRLGGSIGDTLTQTTITLEAMAGGTALHGEPNSQEGFSRDNFFVLLLLYCSTVYYGCV